MALEVSKIQRHRDELRRKLSPLIKKLGDRYINAPVDPAIEIILSSTRDPVLAHGLDIIGPLRGFYYRSTVDQNKDVNTAVTRQFTGYSMSPQQTFKEVVPGLKGRMTSRQEDETICVGGIIGLDVTRMLQFTAGKKREQKQVEEVCAARMREFYLALKKMPDSMLFWNVPRLQDQGFSWAPRTFMQRGESKAYGSPATITRSGLFSRLSGITLPNISPEDLLAKRTIHVDTDLAQVYIRPDTTFYKQFPDFDPKQRRDFELVHARPPAREAFIAETVRKKGAIKVLRYLMFAVIVDELVNEDCVYIKGDMLGGQHFCII